MFENKIEDCNTPYFSKAFKSGGHSKSIKAVIDGKADCAVIDRGTRESLEKLDPSISSKYRIIKNVIIGEMPAQPICVVNNIDLKTREKICNAFLNLNNNEMKELNILKYEKVNHEFYESLQRRINNSKFIQFGIEEIHEEEGDSGGNNNNCRRRRRSNDNNAKEKKRKCNNSGNINNKDLCKINKKLKK